MIASISFPHRSLPEEVFGTSPWSYRNPQGELIDVSGREISVDGWDYNMDLDFQRQVHLDVTEIYRLCHLSRDAEVQLICSWFCPTTKVKKIAYRSSNLGIDENAWFGDLKISINGEELAESLFVDLELVLVNTSSPADRFVASRPGHKIAQQKLQVRLEGSGSQFPTSAVNFAESSFPTGACWHLQWSHSDLEGYLMNDVRLYLNSGNPEFIRKVSDPDSEMASVVSWDVARRLISGALANDSFVENAENYPSESIGGVVVGLLQLCYPGKGMNEVSSIYLSDREKFETQLQASLGGFHA
jgi:hypothetical protein